MPEFTVTVADNYHYMDKDEWWTLGVFASAEAAVAAAKSLVDGSLKENYEPGLTADALYGRYKMFGEDPFVTAEGHDRIEFSAWNYAKARCPHIVAQLEPAALAEGDRDPIGEARTAGGPPQFEESSQAKADFSYAIAVIDKSVPGSETSSVAQRRVAAHASAHAVVGLLNGLRVERVTLQQVASGDWIGRVDWAHPALDLASGATPRRRRRRAHHQLLNAYLAGRGAQLLQGYGWPGETFTLDYTAPDTEAALALALMICPQSPERIIRGASRYVRDFILDPVVASAIDQLAYELIDDRDLTGDEVRRFVTKAFRAEA